MSVKEFADKFIKADIETWKKGNYEAMEAIQDPDVIYHFHIGGTAAAAVPTQDIVGQEAVKRLVLAEQQAAPDFSPHWTYLTGSGNVFALSYEARFAFVVERPGIPAGKEVTEHAMFVIRLEKGKVVEVWASIMEALSDK